MSSHRKHRYRRGSRLILHPPHHSPVTPPAPTPGPERVRLPTRELPSRPFAALEQLRRRMLREVGQCEQPTTPERWE